LLRQEEGLSARILEQAGVNSKMLADKLMIYWINTGSLRL
jgi:hypothetical protein